LHITIPLAEALEQMPMYDKFMKDVLKKKTKFIEEYSIGLKVGYSAIIQKSLPLKYEDPRSFTIPVTIGELPIKKCLTDLGLTSI